jgi:hypothetical protein
LSFLVWVEEVEAEMLSELPRLSWAVEAETGMELSVNGFLKGWTTLPEF